MEPKQFICSGQKYTYSKGYIALPIKVTGLPDSISTETHTLYRKSEFHVSLLYVKGILLEHPSLEEQVLDVFCACVQNFDVSMARYTGEFRLVQKDKRASFIALCAIKGLEELFETLRNILKIGVPTQPTHVTLFTLQPEAGIGLNSPDEMAKYSVPVPALDTVLRALGLCRQSISLRTHFKPADFQ